MRLIQKFLAPAVILICGVLVLGACSPDPDPVIPTDKVKITNIPAEMFRTDDVSSIDVKEPTFKVFVQLSNAQIASESQPGLGKAIMPATKESNGTYTVTIEELFEQDNVTPWVSENYAFASVIICPANVEDIFDIDMKAGVKGPSNSSSTIEINWATLTYSRTNFLAMEGFIDGIENYMRLYYGIDKANTSYPDEGVIRLDRAGVGPGPHVTGTVEPPPLTLKASNFKPDSN